MEQKTFGMYSLEVWLNPQSTVHIHRQARFVSGRSPARIQRETTFHLLKKNVKQSDFFTSSFVLGEFLGVFLRILPTFAKIKRAIATSEDSGVYSQKYL